MLPLLKNLKRYISSDESTILYLIEKEVIQQPTECPNCHNSRINRRIQRWHCTKKQCRKEWPIFENKFNV
ncbi:hypothetical protein HZS_4911 [Henneguya salminicola]|nr:hypothetical protein HZS_4911 [Henneguya salminicola]